MTPQEQDARIASQWVLVHNPKKSKFGMEIDVDTEYFVAYAYVDRQAGLTLDLWAFCTVDSDTITLTSKPQDDNSRTAIRFSHARIKWLEPTVLTDAQHKALSLPTEPDYMDAYKVENQETIDRVRKIELLHPLRAPGFPDDIRFVLPPMREGMQIEEVWGRIVANPKPEIYVVVLLVQPKQDFDGIKQGDYLAVEVKAVGENISSVCVGKLQPPPQ